jgi:aspartyl-tRNA synthetase
MKKSRAQESNVGNKFIDRIVQLLTDENNIRNVLAFPLMKEQSNDKQIIKN